ncbi:MAG: 50S ribosomal protein L4 [Acidobacteria bacterium RBG_16_64_8]|nr:MAG: 50S ribosomal protein L4 [Acidobacteria bacterium RBG_16_64_8]
MKIAVRNLENQEVRKIDLPEEIFAYPFKEHLVHLAVQSHLGSLRRGTHKTKVRGEVSGSGKKLWRQKGTGRARIGSIRSPLWRKGGTVHGPVPRSYANDLSAGEKRNALKSVLSRKAQEERIIVLDSFELTSPKTKELATSLARLGVAGRTLLVDQWDNEHLTLASRNHPELKTVDALAVNVYDVVDRPFLVLSEHALQRLVEVLTQ